MMKTIIESRNLLLRPAAIKDESFIYELFSDDDVRRFYVLSDTDTYSKNIKLFFYFMINSFGYKAFDFVMQLQDGTAVGIMCAEPRTTFYPIAWDVSYAVLPAYRGKGYAVEGLMAFTDFLKQFNIPVAYLDISSQNKASEHVAAKAGYKKNDFSSHVDLKHFEDLDVLYNWEYELISMRDMYFNKGVSAFNEDRYALAVDSFRKAVTEPYSGGPNTDALCYSNMGIASSHGGDYCNAYVYLKKAMQLGLCNDVITRELNWLKENKGIG